MAEIEKELVAIRKELNSIKDVIKESKWRSNQSQIIIIALLGVIAGLLLTQNI